MSKARRALFTAIRCAVCTLAVCWLVRTTEWTAFEQAILDADWRMALIGFAVLGLMPIGLALRLRWLLEVHGVSLSVWRTVKVTFAGNFIIGATPLGTQGGDAMKAYYIARDTPYKHETVTTVIVDRVIGVISLVGLAGMVCLLNSEDPVFLRWGRILGWVVVVMLVGGGMYFSTRLRRFFRVDAILSRLPLSVHLRRIDAAIFGFRHRPGRVAGAILVTVVLQTIAIVSHFLIGWALGMVYSRSDPLGTLTVYLAYVPICFLASVLPIGAMELTYVELFAHNAGLGTPETATSLSLLSRLIPLVWSTPGFLMVLRTGRSKAIAEGVFPESSAA